MRQRAPRWVSQKMTVSPVFNSANGTPSSISTKAFSGKVGRMLSPLTAAHTFVVGLATLGLAA